MVSYCKWHWWKYKGIIVTLHSTALKINSGFYTSELAYTFKNSYQIEPKMMSGWLKAAQVYIFNSWLNNDFSPYILYNKINPTYASINYGRCILMPACCQHTNKEQSWKRTAIQVWIMRWICIRSSRRRVSAIVNHFICKPLSSGRKQLALKWYPSVSTWRSSSPPFNLRNILRLSKIPFCQSQAINKLHVSRERLNHIPHLWCLQPTCSSNSIQQFTSREKAQHWCNTV